MSNALPVVVNEPSTTEHTGVTGPRIRCPLCEWTPHRKDVWSCTCGNLWHTFETGGVCPACFLQWSTTQCFSCHVFSAHAAWYEYD